MTLELANEAMVTGVSEKPTVRYNQPLRSVEQAYPISL